MRFIYILIAVFSISCSHSKNITNGKTTSSGNIKEYDSRKYRVTKIDSVKNVYLIYARKDSMLFKIVSAKVGSEDCGNIKISGEYGFIISSIFPDNSPAHVDGIYYHGVPIAVEGDSITHIYIALNVAGLCIKQQ